MSATRMHEVLTEAVRELGVEGDPVTFRRAVAVLNKTVEVLARTTATGGEITVRGLGVFERAQLDDGSFTVKFTPASSFVQAVNEAQD